MRDQSVLTIAVGKQYYVELAINLARSFLRWNNPAELSFYFATDRKDLLPDDIRDRIEIVEIEPGQYGEGFTPKLYIDQMIKTQSTLFIDADCIVYGPVKPIFGRFQGHSVSVIGQVITEGEFFGDVAHVRRNLKLSYLLRYIGAVYYVERSEIATSVFEQARRLRPCYDELGLVRLRGKENEEPLLSIAMASHNLKPVHDDGSIKADAMCYRKMRTDVLSGFAKLENSDNDYPNWIRIVKALPVIVHYNCAYAENAQYRAESLKLKKVTKDRWSETAAKLLAFGLVTMPAASKDSLKNMLRPIYRKLFGFRPIRRSRRL